MCIEIIGRPLCKYCENSKILAYSKNVPFDYKELDVDVTREDVIARIGHDFRTVPQIFIGDEYIGGYDDLVEYFNKQQD